MFLLFWQKFSQILLKNFVRILSIGKETKSKVLNGKAESLGKRKWNNYLITLQQVTVCNNENNSHKLGSVNLLGAHLSVCKIFAC